ncbi:MAG TPA: hypothetical protein VNN10_02720 [Dehalococcoidia bacterium]|nr:hypothetical protein [Dehalococcoidia bacterium]
MPERRKPTRKPLGFFDARDRMAHLNNAYRVQGGRPLDPMSQRFQRELAEVDSPEPGEELQDAELSDGERRQAMERERLRRERRG